MSGKGWVKSVAAILRLSAHPSLRAAQIRLSAPRPECARCRALSCWSVNKLSPGAILFALPLAASETAGATAAAFLFAFLGMATSALFACTLL